MISYYIIAWIIEEVYDFSPAMLLYRILPRQVVDSIARLEVYYYFVYIIHTTISVLSTTLYYLRTTRMYIIIPFVQCTMYKFSLNSFSPQRYSCCQDFSHDVHDVVSISCCLLSSFFSQFVLPRGNSCYQEFSHNVVSIIHAVFFPPYLPIYVCIPNPYLQPFSITMVKTKQTVRMTTGGNPFVSCSALSFFFLSDVSYINLLQLLIFIFPWTFHR